MSSEEDKSAVRRNSDGVKGVLVHLKSRKQKKSVSWKDDGLEAIRYFELDENERGEPEFVLLFSGIKVPVEFVIKEGR